MSFPARDSILLRPRFDGNDFGSALLELDVRAVPEIRRVGDRFPLRGACLLRSFPRAESLPTATARPKRSAPKRTLAGQRPHDAPGLRGPCAGARRAGGGETSALIASLRDGCAMVRLRIAMRCAVRGYSEDSYGVLTNRVAMRFVSTLPSAPDWIRTSDLRFRRSAVAHRGCGVAMPIICGWLRPLRRGRHAPRPGRRRPRPAGTSRGGSSTATARAQIWFRAIALRANGRRVGSPREAGARMRPEPRCHPEDQEPRPRYQRRSALAE